MRTYETVHMKHLNKHLSLKGAQYTVTVTITIFPVFVRFQGSEKWKVRISGLVAESDQFPIFIARDLFATGITRKKTQQSTQAFLGSPDISLHLGICYSTVKDDPSTINSESLSVGPWLSSHWEREEPSLRHI